MDTLTIQLGEFWEIIKEVWHTGMFGYSIGDVLIAIAIFLVFYGLRGIFRQIVSRLITRWLHKRTSAKERGLDKILIDAFAGPLQLAFVTFGVFFALQYVGLEGDLSVMGDRIVRTLIAIAIFWAIYDAVLALDQVFQRLSKVLTPEMLDWLLKGVRWAVLFVAAATILQLWGIQVAPILAGLGLFGVAVALGAQELFRNLIGGLCVLIEKPFFKGDWILVDGVVEGTVERIGFRTTQLRRFDAAPVSVPNMKLSDAAVTNFSRMTARRISWTIALDRCTSIEQLQQIRSEIEAYLYNAGVFVTPPTASLFVRIDSFSESSIDIMLYTFTKTTVWGEWLEHKENLAYEIKEIVARADARFAYPTQSVYIERDITDVPQPLAMPEQGVSDQDEGAR